MNINFKDAVSYLTFKDLEKYDFFRHAYSTRIGGVSKSEFKSLNLGFKTADKRENIEENFEIFCKAFGVDKERLALTAQVHKDNIEVVDNIEKFTVFPETDGLITNKPGVTLVTFHADCSAVYMVDIKKKVVGLAHAGWRGTVKNIAGKLAKKFLDVYSSSKDDLVCAIGPNIGRCCFEVKGDVMKEFLNLGISKNLIINEEKVDLSEVNKRLLINFGLKEENIIKSDVCTMCSKDLLFSHRATNGKRGTNSAFISLN